MTFRRNRCRLTGKVMYWFTPIRYILRTICSDCGHEITKTRVRRVLSARSVSITSCRHISAAVPITITRSKATPGEAQASHRPYPHTPHTHPGHSRKKPRPCARRSPPTRLRYDTFDIHTVYTIKDTPKNVPKQMSARKNCLPLFIQ